MIEGASAKIEYGLHVSAVIISCSKIMASSAGLNPRETLIYSVKGYNTDHHLQLHEDLLNASTNASR